MDFEFDIRSNLIATVFAFLVWGVLEYVRSLIQTQLFQILPLSWESLVTLALAFVIIFLIFTILGAKRSPIVGVQAYLFFPRNTHDQDKKLEFNEEHHYHRTIVNSKTNPPTAFYLPTGSYAWKWISKHPELCFSETEEEQDKTNPDFLKEWCGKRGYQLQPHPAGRDDLLFINIPQYSTGNSLDPRLRHVEYRYFYPLYHRLFRSRSGVPSRRAILNWSAMKAFPLDFWTMKLVGTGKIRGSTMIWMPIPHHVQRWTRKHGFEWSDKLPTIEDLLAKDNRPRGKRESK